MTKLLPQISSLLQQKAAQCLSVDTGRIAGAGCGHSCGGSRRLAEHKTAGNHTDGRAGHCVGGNGTSRHQKIGYSARDKAAVRNTKKRTVFQRIVGAAGIVLLWVSILVAMTAMESSGTRQARTSSTVSRYNPSTCRVSRMPMVAAVSRKRAFSKPGAYFFRNPNTWCAWRSPSSFGAGQILRVCTVHIQDSVTFKRYSPAAGLSNRHTSPRGTSPHSAAFSRISQLKGP